MNKEFQMGNNKEKQLKEYLKTLDKEVIIELYLQKCYDLEVASNNKTCKQKLKDLIINNLDISVNKFCDELGLSSWTINNILKDYGQQPGLLTIKKICKYFNVDFRNYWDGE